MRNGSDESIGEDRVAIRSSFKLVARETGKFASVY